MLILVVNQNSCMATLNLTAGCVSVKKTKVKNASVNVKQKRKHFCNILHFNVIIKCKLLLKQSVSTLTKSPSLIFFVFSRWNGR